MKKIFSHYYNTPYYAAYSHPSLPPPPPPPVIVACNYIKEQTAAIIYGQFFKILDLKIAVDTTIISNIHGIQHTMQWYSVQLYSVMFHMCTRFKIGRLPCVSIHDTSTGDKIAGSLDVLACNYIWISSCM